MVSTPALADFTVVSEATVERRQQLTTVSLRGTMLRVSVVTGKVPPVLILRDTTTGVTVISEPAEKRVQRIVDLPDAATAPSNDRLLFRFDAQLLKRRLLGHECIDHLAASSSPQLSFSGCDTPWSTIDLDAAAFARLFPPMKTLVMFPLLTM